MIAISSLSLNSKVIMLVPLITICFDPPMAGFSIGNKLIAIGNNSSTVLYYDVEKDEWSEETCNLTKNKSFFSCSFLPHIKF